MITFKWDEKKNSINLTKHHVSFDEAVSVFLDNNGLLIDDPDHSEQEERFVMMGMSNKGNVLIVCHCYRNDDEIIRIISARKANKKEIACYLGGFQK